MAENETLNIIVNLVDNASRQIDAMGKKVDQFGDKMKKSFGASKELGETNRLIKERTDLIKEHEEVVKRLRPLKIDITTTPEFKRSKENVDSLTRALDELKAKKTSLSLDSRRFTLLIKEARAEMAALPDEKVINLEIKANKDQLRKDITEAEASISEFKKQVDEKLTDRASLEVARTQLRKQMAEERQALAKLQEVDPSTLSSGEKGGRTRRINNLKKSLQEEEALLREFRVKEAQQAFDIRVPRKAIASLNEFINEAKRELSTLNEFEINPEVKLRREQLQEDVRQANEILRSIADQTIEIDANIEELKIKKREAQAELTALSKQKYTADVQVKIDNALAEIFKLRGELEILGKRKLEIKADIDKNTPTIVRAISDALSGLAETFDNMGKNTSTLGRVLIVVLVALSYILPALLAVGAALVSVGSAALFAATAVGGALVAALAQALPAVGLLFVAFKRLQVIFQSIQADRKEDEKASVSQGRNAHQLAVATNNVTQAQERLADAQKNLTKARQDALRSLQDLTLAERSARLEAENAQLGKIGAQAELRGAITGGSALDIRRAQLGVRGADINVDQANLGLQRAGQDLSQARTKGVEGSDQVVQARRQVRDATIALTEAELALQEAAKGTAAAQDRATIAAAKLDPVEKKLKDALLRIKATFESVNLTDPILAALTKVADQANEILANSDVGKGARILSESIGTGITNFFSKAFKPDQVDILKQLFAQASETIPLVGTAFGEIVGAIERVAVAAGPLVKDFLTSFNDWVSKVAKSADDRKKLGDFFEKGAGAARAFGRLMKSIGDLLLALFETSSDSGVGLVDRLTGKISGLAKFLTDNKEEVGEFFDRMADSAAKLGGVIVSLVKAFSGAALGGQLDDISDLLQNSVIPAFGDLLLAVAGVLSILGKLSNIPGVGEVLRLAITFLALLKITAVVRESIIGLMPVLKGLARLIGFILPESLKTLGKAFIQLFMTNPWVRVITLIVIALIALEVRFHFVEKGLKLIQQLAPVVWDGIKDGAQAVLDFFKNVWGNSIVQLVITPWKVQLTIFKDLFKDVLRYITDIFDGVKKVFSGFFDVLVGIFTLNGGKIKSGFAQIFKGFADIAIAPVRLIYEGIRSAINAIITVINTVIDHIPGHTHIGLHRISGGLPAFDDIFGGDSQDSKPGPNVSPGAAPLAHLGANAAAGGVFAATPGGQRVRLAEAGYDEFVLTTDPKQKSRTSRLLSQFFKKTTGRSFTDKRLRYLHKYADEFAKAEGGLTDDTAAATPTPTPRADTANQTAQPVASTTGNVVTSSGATGDASFPGPSVLGERYHGAIHADEWLSAGMALVGVSGDQWLSMLRRQASRESGFNPYAINLTDINAKNGIPSKGILQTIGPTFDSYKVPGHGNIWNPIDNTAAAIRYMISRYGRGSADRALSVMTARGGGAYDSGGEVPGTAGQPQMAIVHAGEMVLNKGQQAMLGGAQYLRKMLGFGGETKSEFATGGIVYNAASSAQANVGIGQLLTDIPKLRQKSFGSADKFVDTYTRLLTLLQGNFDTLTNDFQDYYGKIDDAVKVATFSFNKAGKAVQADDIKGVETELTDLALAQKEILGQGPIFQRRLKNAKAALARARRAGNADAIQLAQGELNQATAGVEGQRAQTAAVAQRTLEAQQRRRDAIVADATEKIGGGGALLRGAALDRDSRLATASGLSQTPILLARRQLFSEQESGLRGALQGEINKGKKGDPKLITQLRDSIAEIQTSIAETTASITQASIDEINRQGQLAVASGARDQKAGQRGNNLAQIQRGIGTQMTALFNQQQDLIRQYGAMPEGANKDALKDQIEELSGTIADLASQQIQAAIDFINDNAQRTQNRINRSMSVAKLFGDSVVGFIQQGIDANRATVSQLQGQLEAAQKAGDAKLAQQLGDQIDDLNNQITEGIVNKFRTAVDEAKKPFETSQSLLGVQLQIAQLSGPGFTADTGASASIVQSILGSLQGERDVLQQKLAEAQSLGLKDDVNDLTLQLAQNQLATLQNTQQLKELNGQGQEPQGFSSLSWTLFRKAIFDGVGNLLPQFAVPQMADGGDVTKTGLFVLHKGERVSNKSEWVDNGNTTIIVNQASQNVDPKHIAKVLAFNKKSTR